MMIMNIIGTMLGEMWDALPLSISIWTGLIWWTFFSQHVHMFFFVLRAISAYLIWLSADCYRYAHHWPFIHDLFDTQDHSDGLLAHQAMKIIYIISYENISYYHLVKYTICIFCHFNIYNLANLPRQNGAYFATVNETQLWSKYSYIKMHVKLSSAYGSLLASASVCLPTPSGNAWVRTQHCGYWWPVT